MDELKLSKFFLLISSTITNDAEVSTPVVLLLLLSNDTSPITDPTPNFASVISLGLLRETRPSPVAGTDDFIILTSPAKITSTESPLSPSEKMVEPFLAYFFTIAPLSASSHFSDSENSSKKETLFINCNRGLLFDSMDN